MVLISMLLALYGAFVYAPTERVMGPVQRIFYVHVGLAWNAFLAFFVVFLYSLLYLVRGRRRDDMVAACSAEVGLIFTTLVLVTGPLWARPVWNTWWPWGDPRLTTTLVLWLIYLAYMVLRSQMEESEQKYKFAAVLGIVGFLDVPIVWMSIRWWTRTLHPVVIRSGEVRLEPRMFHALLIAVVAFGLLYLYLLQLRLGIEQSKSRIEQFRQQSGLAG